MLKRFLKWKPSAQVTIAFSLLLALIAAFFHEKIPVYPALISIYLGIIAAQVFLTSIRSRNKVLEYISDLVFPVLAVLVIFESLRGLVHCINPRDIDSTLIRWDYWITGGYPSVYLERFIHPILTELLQLAYTSYYFLPIVLGAVLKGEKREREFDRSLFIILLCFYLSYIGYILFPALGPRYTMHFLYSRPLNGIWLAGHINHLLNGLEGINRDAFPSGHTAIALTVLALSFRYSRRLFYIFIPFVAGLVFATVYLRYHYLVDVFGGIILFVLSLKLGDGIYGQWQKRFGPDHRG